jgi:hypothetical protein
MTRAEFVRSLHPITVNVHVVETEKTRTAKNEMPRRHLNAWHVSNFQCLDGDARQAHSDGTSWETAYTA